MNNENKSKFIEVSSTYITNLDRVLKNIKSEVMADFVHNEQVGIIIVINKVASPLDLQTIESYVKSSNNIDEENVEVPCLLQSKSHLKIIDIPYLLEGTKTPILADVVKLIIKSNHIFNNIAIVSRPYIIKVSLKSDMAIIWLDIWDVQSGNNTRWLINWCFNIKSYIVTIRGTNINPGVLQCKNC